VITEIRRSEGETDLPIGMVGDKCNGGISYLRLKNLPQIRSRVPGKLPKTIPTTTVTTATSEKTTQNFGLITRQFAWSQAIIAQSLWTDFYAQGIHLPTCTDLTVPWKKL